MRGRLGALADGRPLALIRDKLTKRAQGVHKLRQLGRVDADREVAMSEPVGERYLIRRHPALEGQRLDRTEQLTVSNH